MSTHKEFIDKLLTGELIASKLDDSVIPFIVEGPNDEDEMVAIGSIHISILPNNPNSYLGYGIWTRIANGKTLVGVDENDVDMNAPSLEFGGKTVIPSGTVSQPVFTGTNSQATSSVSAGTPAGTVSQPTFTGNSVSSNSVSAGTPAGTNSVPTFTGSPLGTHAHELPFQINSTTAIRQIAVGTFGTGTSRAATAQQTHTANTTSAAVALSQAVSAGTPAGTVSAPTFTGSAMGVHSHTTTATGTVSAPTFTGSALGSHSHTVTPSGTVSQPSFTGNSVSVIQPSFTVYFWLRTG